MRRTAISVLTCLVLALPVAAALAAGATPLSTGTAAIEFSF